MLMSVITFPVSTDGQKNLISHSFADGAVNFDLSAGNVEKGVLQDITAPTTQSMYDHFAECIENSKEPEPSLMEGYKTLQLVRAIYKSIETGLPVNVADIDF